MNQLLLAALAVSGAFDLVAGIWAIVRPSNFASFWLGTDVAEPSLVIPIVAVGLGALALSLLHLLAIHWLRKEKKEAYGLSISLGGGLTVAALFLVLYRVLGHQPLNLALELIAEGARGAALAVIGIAARNAPATVKELRLPKERVREARGRDRRMDQREVRGGGRGGRSGGHGRDRDRDREHDFGQRRERGRRGGREGREAAAPRGAGGPGQDRREPAVTSSASSHTARREPRESVSSPSVPGIRPARPAAGPSAGEREGRDRWSSRRGRDREQDHDRDHTTPVTEDVRSLGVVVTGKPPVGLRQDRPRVESPAETEEVIPRAPMVPRLRAESLVARPLPPDDEEQDAGTGEGSSDRRRRRRRRRSSRGSSGAEALFASEPSPTVEPAESFAIPRPTPPSIREPRPERVERPGERHERADRPERFDGAERAERPERPERAERPEREERPDRPERRERPERPERQERFDRSERFDRPERHAEEFPRELDRPVAEPMAGRDHPLFHEPPAAFEPERLIREDVRPAAEAGEGQEPIDMLSAFGNRESSAEAAASSPYGRHKRPFSPHRKGKQVKPRETKVHHSLGGGGYTPEPAPTPAADAGEEPAPAAPPERPKRIAVEGRIGPADGIGPIDLTDDSDRQEP